MFDMSKYPVELVLKNSAIRYYFVDKNSTRVIGTVPTSLCSNHSLNGYIDANQAKIYPFVKNPR